MKRGPTQATMERALPAAPPLTDWMPCTTPPVRDGEYEFRLKAGFVMADGKAKPCKFISGNFYDDIGKLWGLTDVADAYEWRGVRRWVLEKPSTYSGSGKAYLQKIPQRGRRAGVPHWHFDLAEAMAFDTQVEANAYALAHCIAIISTAVLP